MRTRSPRPRPRSSHGEARPFAGMRHVTSQAAGVDRGAHERVACVPDGETQQIVRTIGTYTADLHSLAAWVGDHGMETVAMASTGVSWMPLFAEREVRGLPCCVIRAQAITRVPGRKRDGLACLWIHSVHRSGCRTASFRPQAALVALRTVLRPRAQRLEHRAPHMLPMPKALVQMHSQLAQALTDVTGTTGLHIIRAIVAGERAPHRWAAVRHSRCKQDTVDMALAFTGTWRAAQLCVRTPSLEVGDVSTPQRQACAAQIATTCSVIPPRFAPCPMDRASSAAPTPPPTTPDSQSKHAPAVNTRVHLLRLTGGDLVAVHGIRASLAQTIIAESGTDMNKWKDEQHVCAWLGLAPNNALSGGKVLTSRTVKHRHRATQAFRMAAQSVRRSHGAFGAFYRRLKGRLGPAEALVATAQKIARTVSHRRKHRVPYHDIGAAAYKQRFQEREVYYLHKKAAKLGYTLSPV